MDKYLKDTYGGALMVLLGIGAVWQGTSYSIGTLSRMGPGLFPVSLGVILICIGSIIAATAWVKRMRGGGLRVTPEWRGWGCIVGSIVAFVVLARYGGLLPATFGIVFIAAMGDRDNSPRDALLLALGICAIGVVVFWWALQLQMPLLLWG